MFAVWTDVLPDIEKAIGVTPIETISIHPLKPLYDACRKMLETRARRIPLMDIDDETQRAMVVSVVTQYRILKFVAVNVKETQMLRKPLRDLNVGSYRDLATADMDTPVMDVIHMLVNKDISSVPILNQDGMLKEIGHMYVHELTSYRRRHQRVRVCRRDSSYQGRCI